MASKSFNGIPSTRQAHLECLNRSSEHKTFHIGKKWKSLPENLNLVGEIDITEWFPVNKTNANTEVEKIEEPPNNNEQLIPNVEECPVQPKKRLSIWKRTKQFARFVGRKFCFCL